MTTTALSPATSLDLAIGNRPGATCPGCGKQIPAARQPVVELETPDGHVVCHHCTRQADRGLHHAAALLNYVLTERQAGRPDRAKGVLLALSDGLELIDEHEADQAAHS